MDEDEKLVTVAIRATGHLYFGYFLVTTSSVYTGWKYEENNLLRWTIESMIFITKKLTIAIESSEADKSDMTWKQKACINKHGWGACYSLLQFMRICSLRQDLKVHAKKSIEEMLRCLCISESSNLNPKISIAALNTLINMDWNEYSKEIDFYAFVILRCVQCLCEVSAIFV